MKASVLFALLLAACQFDARGVPSDLENSQEDSDLPAGDWWDSAFGKRVPITLAHAPAADLSDFVALVVLSEPSIDFVDLAGDGADIRFVSDSGVPLAHEIEAWSNIGPSYVWVRLPTITSAGDTRFWMYYDNSEAVAADAPEDVWSGGYVAVLHLSEEAADEDSATVHGDSTGNGNEGAQSGNAGQRVMGGIGGVQQFDGQDDYISLQQAGLRLNGAAITIEVRAFLSGEPNDFPHVVGAGSDGRYWQLFWYSSDNGWTNRYRISGEQYENWTTAGRRDEWTNLASVYDGDRVYLYVNGVAVDSDNVPDGRSLSGLDTDVWLGSNPELSPREFAGYLDEVRVSSVARSAAWLEIEQVSLSGELCVFGQVETL